MFRRSIQSITQKIKIRKQAVCLQIKSKFYCNICLGKGTIPYDNNGKLAYSTCPRCSGVGHHSYTYF
jgi:hypothetical protein